MKRLFFGIWKFRATVVAVLTLLVWTLPTPARGKETAQETGRQPKIYPEYIDAVIPPNIAPLNFSIIEPGVRYSVEVKAAQGDPIRITSKNSSIVIPPRSWRSLLSTNKGGKITFDVSVLGEAGQWQHFTPIENTVAQEEIDRYLVYRIIGPVYNMWREMGIYQRDLENYDQKPIIENETISLGCLNCHTFQNNSADNMLFQVRSMELGRPTIIGRGGVVSAVDTRTDASQLTAVYCSWHPNGKIVAMSGNKITQFFHTAGPEGREVFDHESSLFLYNVDTNTVTTTKEIYNSERMNTYPNWTPDGKTLYFTSAPKLPVERFKEVLYDLMRIGYDPDTGAWGQLEKVVPAEPGKSVTHPKPSPDGKYVLFTVCDHGNFSILQKSSDLFMLDIASGKHDRLDINSDETESYHSWSSNSRWFVFSSKRRDGLMARPYFSYIDEKGKVYKPFMLPQKDPLFYDSFLKTFNIPELIKSPVPYRQEQFSNAVWAKNKVMKPRLDPSVEVPKKEEASGATVASATEQATPISDMPWKAAPAR